MENVTRDAVALHYRRLAPRYSRKANRACLRAYRELVARHLSKAGRVLELGAGAADILANIHASQRVAVDLTPEMMRARPGIEATVADAQQLPFKERAFDGIFCINLLEHVPSPERVIEEAARLLTPGGRFLAITPNGDLAGLLGLLERLRLKLPEGPHRFLGTGELTELVGIHFRLIEHKAFLALPLGTEKTVRLMDTALPWGLFQSVLGEQD